jgi:hypothetical protein
MNGSRNGWKSSNQTVQLYPSISDPCTEANYL